MTELGFVFVLLVGGAIWWKMKKDREPAIIGEVIHNLRLLGDARHPSYQKRYHAMADAIQEAEGYAMRRQQPVGEDRARIRAALNAATNMDLLEQLGFFHASGKASQARDALFSLWKKVAP